MGYGTEVPAPSPSGVPAKGTNGAGIGVVVFLIALGVLAVIGIRRAAARYRRRIHDEDEP
jgi:hypothetical protein